MKQVRQLPLGRRHPPQTKLNKLGKNLDLQHFHHVRFVLSAPVPLTLDNKSHPGKKALGVFGATLWKLMRGKGTKGEADCRKTFAGSDSLLLKLAVD